jgi:hypothetical protein
MKKLFMLAAFLLAVSIFPQNTYASEKIAEASAKLQPVSVNSQTETDMRVVALQKVFNNYNPTLAPYAGAYVKYADRYDIDWRLLPAISGLESSFATYYVPGTYNAYGWGGGYIYFDSWEDGIDTISRALRENYYDRGADTVWKIGPIYAEADHWSTRVNSFMGEINDEYVKLTTLAINPTL